MLGTLGLRGLPRLREPGQGGAGGSAAWPGSAWVLGLLLALPTVGSLQPSVAFAAPASPGSSTAMRQQSAPRQKAKAAPRVKASVAVPAKPAPAKPAPAKPAPAEPAPAEPAAPRPAESRKPEAPLATPPAAAASQVVKTEQRAGETTYTFGEQEVEGRLKSPQILYFLRRVRAQFDPAPLGHRSFLLELSDTRRHPALE